MEELHVPRFKPGLLRPQRNVLSLTWLQALLGAKVDKDTHAHTHTHSHTHTHGNSPAQLRMKPTVNRPSGSEPCQYRSLR